MWYPAYGNLSAFNIGANERLRKGLRAELGERDLRKWVYGL